MFSHYFWNFQHPPANQITGGLPKIGHSIIKQNSPSQLAENWLEGEIISQDDPCRLLLDSNSRKIGVFFFFNLIFIIKTSKLRTQFCWVLYRWTAKFVHFKMTRDVQLACRCKGGSDFSWQMDRLSQTEWWMQWSLCRFYRWNIKDMFQISSRM